MQNFWFCTRRTTPWTSDIEVASFLHDTVDIIKKYYYMLMSGHFHGVVLVEVLWKMVMVILNHHLGASIALHDVLHGLWVRHGMGTASLKAKIIQHLTSTREEVLYATFLVLHK